MSYDVINGRISYLGNLVPMALSSYSPPPRENSGNKVRYRLSSLAICTNTLLPILNYQKSMQERLTKKVSQYIKVNKKD